ncbi:MAG: invasion associated locus B family protein [Rhizobiaceae bacterium]|jgi:invasion protein IalB|nr:invasion associated locus B family protein [Rhizobiaceae bacterium]
MHFPYRPLAGAVAAVGMLAAAPSALAQSAPAPAPTWFKVCAKQADVDVCNTQNQIIAPNGQLVTAVSLLDIKGKTNRKIFQVSVPPGRLLPPGIAMVIDGGKPQKVDYSVCFADRCIAEAELTDNLLASLKKGGELTLTSVNFQRQQNPVKVSLTGFTGAFEGEPIQQTDALARQKQVEEWVAKNKAEFEKKVLEAQEQAKGNQGN